MTCQRMVTAPSALPMPEVQRSKMGSLETLGEDKQGPRFSLSLPFIHEEPGSSGKADQHPLAQYDKRWVGGWVGGWVCGSHTWNKP